MSTDPTTRLLSQSSLYQSLIAAANQALTVSQLILPVGAAPMDGIRSVLTTRGDISKLIDNIPALRNTDGSVNPISLIWSSSIHSSPGDALAAFLQTSASGLSYTADQVASLYQAAGLNTSNLGTPANPVNDTATANAWGATLVDVNGGEPPAHGWYLDGGIPKFAKG
jgi:hypothetical protein